MSTFAETKAKLVIAHMQWRWARTQCDDARRAAYRCGCTEIATSREPQAMQRSGSPRV